MCVPDPPHHPPGSPTSSGYVALVGRPNAGKSTLMNALLGERLSIVTPKAQTTWRRVTGILTTDRTQMIFLDTPGLLDPKDLLQRTMLAAALEALAEADLVLFVVDATVPPSPAEKEIVGRLMEASSEVPHFAAVNKIDAASPDQISDTVAWLEGDLGWRTFSISALQGEGIGELTQALEDNLPPGPFLYPRDEIARDPVRFFVAEMVRETIFETYYQEIPYSTFCQIEEFREGQEPIYIQANIFVERNSQKRILIGKGGASIRKLGATARKKVEEFLGRAVYLDLWVKILPDWRKKRGDLRRLGFSVPDERSGDEPA